VDAAIKHFEDRAQPEALVELYRKSLLDALDACTKPLSESPTLTSEDHALLELWCDGLQKSAKNDPWWKAMLDEDIPPATLRLLSVEPGNDSSYCPSCESSSSAGATGFRYRKSSANVPLAIDVTRRRLELSPYLEEYLAVNLTAALREKFSEITGGHHRDAFNRRCSQD